MRSCLTPIKFISVEYFLSCETKKRSKKHEVFKKEAKLKITKYRANAKQSKISSYLKLSPFLFIK